MIKQCSYVAGVTAVAQYCQIKCPLPTSTNVPVPQMITSATFYGFTTGTPGAGAVQPIILTGNGLWQAFGTIISLTAAGAIAFSPQQLVGPVLGVGIAITTLVTTATLYLECDAVII